MCPHSFLNSVQDQSGFVHGILRLVHIINCVYALLDVARGVGSFRLGIDEGNGLRQEQGRSPSWTW